MKCKFVIIPIFLLLFCPNNFGRNQTLKAKQSKTGQNQSPQILDIVFNEILADPTPSVELPLFEFIELFNRSTNDINLKDWQLQIGNKKLTLPNYLLPSKQFLILSKDVNGFESQQHVLKISLPTISNVETVLMLYDQYQNCIDWMPYKRASYPATFKSGGGWALERINPESHTFVNNWSWSESLSGGTPGNENSILNTFYDTSNPYITSFEVINPKTIKFLFNKRIKHGTFILSSPESIIPFTTEQKQANCLELNLATELDSLKNYRLSCRTITDMNNNGLIRDYFKFTIPKTPGFNDLIINEIMPNPLVEEPEYVELFNRTKSFLDLQNLKLGKRKSSGEIQSAHLLSPLPQIIAPESYVLLLAFLPDTVIYHQQLFEASYLQLSNYSGTIVLMQTNRNIVDEFSYSSKMHSPHIANNKGVALERINPQHPTNTASNWTSAGSSCNYCTPGKINSQFIGSTESDNWIQFSSKEITPNSDGQNDVLIVSVHCNNVDALISIKIYDVSGRLVNSLANNALSGITNTFQWCGNNTSGKRAGTGVYLLVTQIYDSNTIKSDKTAIAVY